MSAQQLQPSDVNGRLLDELGIVRNVDISSAGTGKTYLLFNTGNIGYPSPSSRTFVAFITCEFSAGAPASGSVVQATFGISGGLEWSLSGLRLEAAQNFFDPPYTWTPTMQVQSSGFYNPPVFTKGLAFTVTINSTKPGPLNTLATFTAWGWAS